MKILGISKHCTLSGQRIRNGGSAVYVDGKIFALGEDRAQGKNMHAGMRIPYRSCCATPDWISNAT